MIRVRGSGRVAGLCSPSGCARLCPPRVPGLELVNRWGETGDQERALLLSAQPPAPARNQTLPPQMGKSRPREGGGLSSPPSGLTIPGAGVGGLLPSGSPPLFSASERKASYRGALNLVFSRSLGNFSCRNQEQRDPKYQVHLSA